MSTNIDESWKQRILIPCTLRQGSTSAQATALVDTGATGCGYINRDLAHNLNLVLTPLKRPIIPYGFDGKELENGTITHTVRLQLGHANHKEYIKLYVTTLGKHDLILGQPWIYHHKIAFDWMNKQLHFNSSRCQVICLRKHSKDVRSKALSDFLETSRWGSPLNSRPNSPRNYRKTFARAGRARHDDWLPRMKQELRQASTKVETELLATPHSDNLTDTDDDDEAAPKPDSDHDMYFIGAAPMAKLARRPDHEIYAVTIADIDKALAPKTYTDPVAKLPAEFHDFLHVFSRKEADKLPEHRSYDHRIELHKGAKPTFGPLYGMSQNELRVLRKYLDENLQKGFIRASSSPVAAPVIFVKKPGGGLRFCVDYRNLNAITVKNRYPIPLIQETLTRLSKAKYYTKLDIIAAFNKLRIAKGDEWLTAFRTRYGLFEYLVMPFGLANAPSTFQHFVNDVLRPFLDVFCTAYIDDILIYSESLEEHKKHVRLVLGALSDAGLQLDIDKSEFFKTEVIYLGYVISTEGIKMDPAKVQAIQEWEYPLNVKDVRAFLGFANFYRRFIDQFSELASPLIALTKKGTAFIFSESCRIAFDQFKKAFITAPILRHFDPELPIVIEADASDYVTAGIISQRDSDGGLRPVAYFSKRMSPAECNYEIYDKELLAIVRCFEQWRPELEGAAFPIEVLSDHRNLQYFTTTKQLSHRQARWSEYLSRFRFEIIYRPGKHGGKPDTLTRRSQDAPAQEEARKARVQTLLPPEVFRQTDLMLVETDRSIQQIIDDEYPNDELIQETLELLRTGVRRSKKFTLAECTFRDGKLYYRNRLVVPDHDELKIKLLRHVHDSPVGGHLGRSKTLEILQREYYWPNMFDSVRRYVTCCHVCRRSKANREKYHGLLKPLPIPDRRWQHISMDFVVDLPLSEGCSNILVVVDRLTKYRVLIPCSVMTAPEVAKLFLRHVWVHYGLPETIVSDRGTQFVSAFWQELCTQLSIKALLSTASHPQTDGQTENANAVMEQVLRAYTNYLQTDWVRWLATAQFAANNTVSESTKVTPFVANYGQNPRMGFEQPTGTQRPPALRLQAQEANRFVEQMKDITEFVRVELGWSQALQQEYANKSRQPAPAYQVGDKVWLDARNIRTTRASKKLDWKNLGPYRVSQIVSSHAYKLDLPKSMSKLHPVFHVWLLRPAALNSEYLSGQQNPPPQPVEIDGEEEYWVECIEDLRYNRRRRRYEYLVKWTGYDDRSWEPADALKDIEPLDRFHKEHPDKPMPNSIRTLLHN